MCLISTVNINFMSNAFDVMQFFFFKTTCKIDNYILNIKKTVNNDFLYFEQLQTNQFTIYNQKNSVYCF